MTYEQFLTDPSVDEHSEWVDGEVIAMMSVGYEHTRLVRFLLRLMADFVDHHESGEVLFEPFNMRLTESGRAPDIMIVTTEHLDRLRENYLDGPADIAVEVVSPGSGGVDRGEKFFEYEAGGVREYWLIDPQRRVAEFYALSERGVYELIPAVHGVFGSRVLPGFWLREAWLWERPKLAVAEAELGLR